MTEQQRAASSSPSSWLLRTRFSRAVCYRPGACKSVQWPSLPSSIPSPPPSKTHQDLPHLAASVPPDPSCSIATDDPCPLPADFSFPSPFSPTSSFSDSSSTKIASDSLYPSTDDDIAVTEASTSVHSSHSSGFLRSVFTSLSSSSSTNRWSFSTDSINAKSPSPRGPAKVSWFGKASPVSSAKQSPCVSQMASPRVSAKSSPVVSPEASPRSSFRKTFEGAKGLIPRVPSWSSLLSNSSGGERAVLSAEKWMVDLSQLLLGERFASGSHSRLYRGIYRENDVAIKVIRQPDDDSLLSDRLLQIFTQEVTMLSNLQHRRVIKFIACCKKPPVLCVITEYLPGGSLRSFLNKRDGQVMAMQDITRMALDIAAGMEYLHMKNVMHRDLKSENLVLAEDGSVKILDFGVSCYENECNSCNDDPGTYRWMAPEMLTHKAYSRKVDVYSFGIVLWEIITTGLPYEELSPVQAAFCVINKGMRPPIPEDCPEALRELLERCWAADPSARPEFWEIMRSLSVYQRSQENFDFVTMESPLREGCVPSWLESE